MIRLRKYFAIVQLAVLLFPQGYQAIHVLKHHRSQPYKSHYSEHVYISFELISNCPILQFQLSVSEQNHLKVTANPSWYPVPYSEATCISYHSYFPGNHICLRAPPFEFTCG